MFRAVHLNGYDFPRCATGWLAAREADSRPAVSEPLRTAGYVVYQTGGGFLAWFLEISEDEYLLITWNDSLDGDPEAAEWAVGRYHAAGGWINRDQSFTLREAMEVAARLPAPRRVGGSMIEEVFDTQALLFYWVCSR